MIHFSKRTCHSRSLMIKYFRFDTDCATFTPTENPRRIRTKRAETKNRKFSTSRWKFTRPSQRQFFPQKRTKKKKKSYLHSTQPLTILPTPRSESRKKFRLLFGGACEQIFRPFNFAVSWLQRLSRKFRATRYENFSIRARQRCRSSTRAPG